MKTPDLVKWILGVLATLLIAGASALGANLSNGIEENRLEIKSLQKDKVHEAAVDARLQTRLDNMARDVERILKLLEERRQHD